jgi:hypothetical protein
VRIYKTKVFARFALKERVSDESLSEAIDRANQGLVDANLGGHVIKQRVARKGQGRSGGYRVLIAFRIKDLAIFLYGFAKNERDNIDEQELATLKDLAAAWMSSNENVQRDYKIGLLLEVKDEHEQKKT